MFTRGLFTSKASKMKETVWLMIREDKPFAIACMLKLWALQSADEKAARDSLYQNHSGFNRQDAAFFGVLVEWFQDPANTGAEPNSSLWQEAVRRLEKYSTQLAGYPDIISLL